MVYSEGRDLLPTPQKNFFSKPTQLLTRFAWRCIKLMVVQKANQVLRSSWLTLTSSIRTVSPYSCDTAKTPVHCASNTTCGLVQVFNLFIPRLFQYKDVVQHHSLHLANLLYTLKSLTIMGKFTSLAWFETFSTFRWSVSFGSSLQSIYKWYMQVCSILYMHKIVLADAANLIIYIGILLTWSVVLLFLSWYSYWFCD